MNDHLHQVICESFENSQNILVVSHIRPDGDCIGSVLGLGLALKDAGKNVQMILRDGIPGTFRHLPGSDLVVRKASQPFDLSVVLDSSDLNRIGGVLEDTKPDLNIDHHITNLHFAHHNFVEPKSAATAAILAKHMPKWGLSISQSVAANLLTGIVSDTIGFRTSNVTPETLRVAADLMEMGVSLDQLYLQALGQRSYESINYWGKGISSLVHDEQIVWATLTLQDRKNAGYTGNDDADLINILSSIQGFDVAIIFVQQARKKVKVSWRAQSGWNVSQIALQFGGGGHPAAAGAEITGTLEEVQKKVLSTTQEALKQQSLAMTH